MKCPKCKKEMERLEYQAREKDIMGKRMILNFYCKKCDKVYYKEIEMEVLK